MLISSSPVSWGRQWEMIAGCCQVTKGEGLRNASPCDGVFRERPVKVPLTPGYLEYACLSEKSNNDDLALSLLDSCLSVCTVSPSLKLLSQCSLNCLCFFNSSSGLSLSPSGFISVSLSSLSSLSVFLFIFLTTSHFSGSFTAVTDWSVWSSLLPCDSQQNITCPGACMTRHTHTHTAHSKVSYTF